MARNKTYERSPIRGSSSYQHKNEGDLIKDRATGELILVIDRIFGGYHCMVQWIGEGDQGGHQRLASWFVDYECERVSGR